MSFSPPGEMKPRRGPSAARHFILAPHFPVVGPVKQKRFWPRRLNSRTRIGQFPTALETSSSPLLVSRWPSMDRLPFPIRDISLAATRRRHSETKNHFSKIRAARKSFTVHCAAVGTLKTRSSTRVTHLDRIGRQPQAATPESRVLRGGNRPLSAARRFPLRIKELYR